MSSTKKLDLYWNFEAGVYLSETQNSILLPLYTLSTCIQYTYSHRKGVVELNKREGVPLTIAFLNLPKGKSLGCSKPATNS
jgi:hypothetical protein